MAETTGNSARWTALSERYKQVLENGGDRRQLAITLAMQIRHAVAMSCGCEEDAISYYACDPDREERTRVDSPYESITNVDSGWNMGIGICLEAAPNAYPKTIVTIQIDFASDGDEIQVSSGVMLNNVTFRRSDSRRMKTAIQSIGEEVYNGFSEALEAWLLGGQKPGRIGFG